MKLHLRNADQAVGRGQQADPRLTRMRSTIVVLAANQTQAVIGHAGDPRCDHFRNGALVGQTKDHSVPKSLVDAGELEPGSIRPHEDRNRLLRALGEAQPVRPTVIAQPLVIGNGDALLLCTDGFWEHMQEIEMEVDLAKSRDAAEWLSSMEVRLQRRVDGSHDNYTAVAVWCQAHPGGADLSTPPLRNSNDCTTDRPQARMISLLRSSLMIFLPLLILLLAFLLFPKCRRYLEHKHHDEPPARRSETFKDRPGRLPGSSDRD